MRPFRLRTRSPLQEVGAGGYQEFSAGTIPVRSVGAFIDDQPLVLVEHERGFQLAFDKHLDAVRKGGAPFRDVDYLATWTGMTRGPAGPPLVRLELAIDGLRPRVRLLFKGGILPPLWLLADGVDFGLVLERTRKPAHMAFTPTWVLGPTPLPDDLRRILRQLEIPAPLAGLESRGWRRRVRRRAGVRRAAAA